MYLLFSLSVIQAITAILDSASNDLLSECHRRSLKKIASLPDSNEEIDDTILTWWSRTELILNNLCRSPLYNPRHTHHTCPCCLSWTKAEMGCVFSHIFPTFFFSFSLCIIVLAAFKPNFYFFFFNSLSPRCRLFSCELHKANSVLMFQRFATYFIEMISSI